MRKYYYEFLHFKKKLNKLINKREGEGRAQKYSKAKNIVVNLNKNQKCCKNAGEMLQNSSGKAQIDN